MESWRNTNVTFVKCSFNCRWHIWCTIHGSGADPVDCCKTLCNLYSVGPIDFMPFVFFLLSSFFRCVTTLQFIRTICDRVVAVQSCNPIVKAAWLWRAALGDRIATTVQAVQAQTDSRPTALRSKSRSKEFWTFQNSTLRLKRLVRPYDDLCDLLRPQWDLTAI